MAKYEYVIEEKINLKDFKKFLIVRKDKQRFSIFANNEKTKTFVEKFLIKKKLPSPFIS